MTSGIEAAFRRAIANVAQHGDTDIFPYPIENRIIFDKSDEIMDLLKSINADFSGSITTAPPNNYGALAPVGYTGFRWATQIDPVWNLYFLSLVISIGGKIEQVRLPIDLEAIFSYRFVDNPAVADLFNREIGWRRFNERAIDLAKRHKFVVSCDISEFYPRLNHHRLENALLQLPNSGETEKKIMRFLSNFSGTYSFGLPVGGPAARILAELTLNQIDRLILQKRISFCRFADDYYLFSETESDAFKILVFISEILQRNQGLQLQKSKTRIMTSSEFIATNPLTAEDDSNLGEAHTLADARRSLLKISLHFDPYSSTAHEDYERLRNEIGQFPILDVIKSELSKSRVNISVARKIAATLQFIESRQLDDAVKTLVENEILLYPVYFNVLAAAKQSFDRMSSRAKDFVCLYVRDLIENKSPVMSVDLNLQYAIRLLSMKRSEESVSLLSRVYDSMDNPAIRQDIILAMSRWNEWIWISDKRGHFRSMRPSERRAYIIGSYSLKDEGSHWRNHLKNEFSQFEIIVRDWISARVNRAGWEIPL